METTCKFINTCWFSTVNIVMLKFHQNGLVKFFGKLFCLICHYLRTLRKDLHTWPDNYLSWKNIFRIWITESHTEAAILVLFTWEQNFCDFTHLNYNKQKNSKNYKVNFRLKCPSTSCGRVGGEGVLVQYRKTKKKWISYIKFASEYNNKIT